MTQQDSPSAWPQEAYRLRPPPGHIRGGNWKKKIFEKKNWTKENLDKKNWTKKKFGPWPWPRGAPPPRTLTWTLTWGGPPRTLTWTLTWRRGAPTPDQGPPCGQTEILKNITFPQTSFAGGKNATKWASQSQDEIIGSFCCCWNYCYHTIVHASIVTDPEFPKERGRQPIIWPHHNVITVTRVTACYAQWFEVFTNSSQYKNGIRNQQDWRSLQRWNLMLFYPLISNFMFTKITFEFFLNCQIWHFCRSCTKLTSRGFRISKKKNYFHWVLNSQHQPHS